MRVFLPPRFPDEKPVLQLLSTVPSHPWVNQYNQVVGHPSIHNWRKEIDVASCLSDVISELSKDRTLAEPQFSNPDIQLHSNHVASISTQPKELPSFSLPQLPPPPYESSTSISGVVAAECDVSISLPTVPDYFSELSLLDLEQLDALASDEVKLLAYANELTCIQTVQEMRSDSIKVNFDLATATISKQAEYESLRTEVVTLQKELLDIKERFESAITKQVALDHARSSDDAILQHLRSAAGDAEVQSDELDSKFSAGELELGEFIKKYQAQRRKYHQLNAHAEWSGLWIR
jgi:vacuolar-type H+-ATPase subunit I/STV1